MAGNFTSVGSLIKKLLAINPKLSSGDLIDIIHQATSKFPIQGKQGFKEVIDEAKAISLAKSTLIIRHLS
jgi:hypothetical protein